MVVPVCSGGNDGVERVEVGFGSAGETFEPVCFVRAGADSGKVVENSPAVEDGDNDIRFDEL